MDIVSILITVVLAMLFLALVVMLPLAIYRNLETGHAFRDGLRSTLDSLRLSRMLENLGLDRESYLHNNRALDVKHHMTRCEACDAKDACDEALQKKEAVPAEELGFCANIDDLRAQQKTITPDPEIQR